MEEQEEEEEKGAGGRFQNWFPPPAARVWDMWGEICVQRLEQRSRGAGQTRPRHHSNAGERRGITDTARILTK